MGLRDSTRRLRELEAKWRRGGYCDYSECADELAAVLDPEGDRQMTRLGEGVITRTPAEAVRPLLEQSPIPLNPAQHDAAKEWAADDRLWTTQETVEMNLRTFARLILKLADTEGDRHMNEFRDAVQALHDYGGMFSRTPLMHDTKGELITTSELMTLVARVMSLSGKWLGSDTEGDASPVRDLRTRFRDALARHDPPPPTMADAAEMLWIVLANVSGGNWNEQSQEWQEAAARWRDYYFAALPDPPVQP